MFSLKSPSSLSRCLEVALQSVLCERSPQGTLYLDAFVWVCILMFSCCNYHYVLYSQVVKTCDVLLNCMSILFERVGLTSVLALRTGSLPRLQFFMFQLYWDLIDLEHCVSWRCLTGDWIHIYCGMITVDVWVNTSISSWTTVCCFVMRAFKITVSATL